MILVAGSFVVGEGSMAALLPVLQSQMAITRAEPGCIEYGFSADLSHPRRIVILERWESQEALSTHLAQPHMAPFLAALQQAGATEVTLRAYDTDGGRPLGD